MDVGFIEGLMDAGMDAGAEVTAGAGTDYDL